MKMHGASDRNGIRYFIDTVSLLSNISYCHIAQLIIIIGLSENLGDIEEETSKVALRSGVSPGQRPTCILTRHLKHGCRIQITLVTQRIHQAWL